MRKKQYSTASETELPDSGLSRCTYHSRSTAKGLLELRGNCRPLFQSADCDAQWKGGVIRPRSVNKWREKRTSASLEKPFYRPSRDLWRRRVRTIELPKRYVVSRLFQEWNHLAAGIFEW